VSGLALRAGAEALGTALLVAVVVGSGQMAQQMGAPPAVALLANTGATVAGLWVLIEVIGPLSGAHFNPLVSLLQWSRGLLPARELPAYALAQFAGAPLGTLLAHAMFGGALGGGALRDGLGVWTGEVVATATLLAVIALAPAARRSTAVVLWIGAAYWFTASTSFANPAVSFGRAFTPSFAGIAPASLPGFWLAQALGAGLVIGLALRYRPRS
jgi:glycerol uptake facilitator-like aquaporin